MVGISFWKKEKARMPAYVITVASQKGGSGKSTLATHLAVAFAQQGFSTMLFDTDAQGSTTHWHAQRKSDDIGLIATSGWRLTRDLAMAREANDIIIIDTPPHAEMDIKVSTRAADLVLIPVQPSPVDLWAIKETYNTVAGESRQALCVFNRVVFRANITSECKQKLATLDVPVADTEIGNRVLFAASMESGLTVLDGFANPSQQEVMSLVREIATRIGIQLKSGKVSVAAPAANPDHKKDTSMAETKKKAPAKKAAPAKKTTTAKPKAAPKAKPAAKPKAAPKAKPAAKPKAAPKKVAKPAVKKAAPKAAPKKVAKPAVKKAPAKAPVKKATKAAVKSYTTSSTTTSKSKKAA